MLRISKPKVRAVIVPSQARRGTITARSARLGMVWTTPAAARTPSRTRRRRAAQTPTGTLTADPRIRATSVS